jgi:hypothetical protein
MHVGVNMIAMEVRMEVLPIADVKNDHTENSQDVPCLLSHDEPSNEVHNVAEKEESKDKCKEVELPIPIPDKICTESKGGTEKI